MHNTDEKSLMVNTSNRHSAQGSEKAIIDILFGLTPRQTVRILDYYYNYSQGCALALLEVVEHIQHLNLSDEDISLPAELSRPIRVLASFERARDAFTAFQMLSLRDDNPDWLDHLTEPSEVECVNDLHRQLMQTVSEVIEIGFPEFSQHLAGSLQYIKTRSAIESLVLASSTVQTLYIMYEKNKAKNYYSSTKTNHKS